MRRVRSIFFLLAIVFLPGTGWPSDSQVDWGIFVQDLSNGQVIYKKNEELFLNPASNAKILTSLAALSLLGPDFTFKTQLLGSESKEKGALKVLILKGEGDPTLSSENLEDMVRGLRSKGVQKVDQVFVDESYFDGEEFPGQMEDRQREASFNCNVGAVAIDHNLLAVLVSPGEKVGAPVHAEVQPPLANFPFKISARTGGKKGRLIVRNEGASEGDLTIAIAGSLNSRSGPQTYKISVHHPSYLTALRLSNALQAQGIHAPAEIQMACPVLKTKVLVENKSVPLEQILQEMNKHSDNFIAEQITKNLGAQFAGTPGSTEKGTAVILNQLKVLGVKTDGITLENGSGLSKKSRVSTETLAQVLARAYQDPKIRIPFLNSLSIMGVDGTLRRRFRHTDLAGRFLGKTGTLRGVSSLSGYLFRKNPETAEPYIFSFIVNGTGADFWKAKETAQTLLQALMNGTSGEVALSKSDLLK